MSKVYLSNVDTPLGYHLVDLLRNDHQNHTDPTCIIGSLSTGQTAPHVYQAINFSQQSQICLRAILQCDLLILNLDFESHQAEVIIKFLQKANSSLVKPLRVIGLSSLMTWQGLKAFQVQKQGERQKIMNNLQDESSWKRIIWTEKDYQKRIPNNFYVKTYQLQNMLIKLNKYARINATVAATGILYGRQNTFLQNQILQSLNGSSLDLIGSGDNLIPLTNYESLMNCIEALISKQKIPYAIICDKMQYSQKQIKQIINDITNNSSPLISKQCLFISKKECDWTSNITVQPSSHFTQILQSRNLQNYSKENLLQDLCDYSCFKPNQYFVIMDRFDEDILNQLKSQLKPKTLLIHQQNLDKFNQQMILRMAPVQTDASTRKKNKNSNSKPSSALQQQRQNVIYYAQAFQSYLKGKKYKDFVIICNQSTFPYLKKDLVFGNLTEIIQNEPQQQIENKIVFLSEQYYNQFNLVKPTNIIKQIQSYNQKQNKSDYVYESQKPLRKDEDLIILNQYLLDNVLLPISQAKFALKVKSKQTNLRNLITQLKDILNRNNTRNQTMNQLQ